MQTALLLQASDSRRKVYDVPPFRRIKKQINPVGYFPRESWCFKFLHCCNAIGWGIWLAKTLPEYMRKSFDGDLV